MFGALGLPELVIIAFIALIIFGSKKRRPSSTNAVPVPSRRVRSLGARAAVFMAAVLVSQVAAFLYSPSGYSFQLRFALIDAIVWLLTFECLLRLQPTIDAASLPVYVLATWIIQRPVRVLVSTAWLALEYGSSPYQLEYLTTLRTWFPRLLFPYTAIELVAVAVMFVVACQQAASARAGLSGAGNAVAHGGVEMSASKTESTRLLCAAAVLEGSRFRHQILERLRDKNHAIPPELGLDMDLLARVCTSAERAERTFDWLFAAAIPVWLVLANVEPSLATAVIFVGTACLFFLRERRRRYSLAGFFRKQTYDPDAVRREFRVEPDPEILASIATADPTLVVYRGFTPFAGAGLSLGGWSFALSLDKPAEGPTPELPDPFELDELYAEVDRALESLNVDGFVASDVFFVNGTDIRGDREILPNEFGRPAGALGASSAQRYRNNSDSRVRHYRWYRVHDWGNELVISHFLRCSRRGQSLFIEISRYLLAPIAEDHRKIDSLTSPKFRDLAGLVVLSLIAGPLSVIGSPFSLLFRLQHAMEQMFRTRERARQREIQDNPLFDYGAEQPIRETYSSSRFIHYFQKIDGDCYNKLFDGQVLNAICDFLHAHHIDTSDLKERQNVIMNSGIIVQGGDVRAESLAVGTGASASKTTQEPGTLRRMVQRQEKTA